MWKWLTVGRLLVVSTGLLPADQTQAVVLRVWPILAFLATATTTVLSLDTTAVLLTPVVLTMTARLGLPPAPFAVLTLWLANTASLLLPVSNLTNLLAADRLARVDQPFITLMAGPAAAVLAMSLLIVTGRHPRRTAARSPLAASPASRIRPRPARGTDTGRGPPPARPGQAAAAGRPAATPLPPAASTGPYLKNSRKLIF